MTVDRVIDLSLLDYLTYKTNCIYLSDLRHTPRWRLLRVIEQIPAQAFSSESWSDCFVYLTQNQPPIRTTRVHDMKQYLIYRLREYHD